jgi:hypothetical protein
VKTDSQTIHTPQNEYSVPRFWPIAAGIELGTDAMTLFQNNLRYVAVTEEISASHDPEWAMSNRILLDLDAMWLRDFQRLMASSRRYRY